MIDDEEFFPLAKVWLAGIVQERVPFKIMFGFDLRLGSQEKAVYVRVPIYRIVSQNRIHYSSD
jgi:hypothetical protein